MKPAEIKRVLASMVIIADTREQDTLRARKRLKAIELPVERAALCFGDYSYRATLPGGDVIQGDQLCAIERKMDLDELAMCFTYSRARFEREWKRAEAAGARLWLMVEDATWSDVYRHRYLSQMTPKALSNSILAWQCRYNSRLIFCEEECTGPLIREILTRDLTERLERGDYG